MGGAVSELGWGMLLWLRLGLAGWEGVVEGGGCVEVGGAGRG